MSFGASSQKLKSFVTEEEANDIKAQRQKEWEKVRRPEDPLERPEEDQRSLYEQLQQQKEKVQQEHDEKYSLKNMIRGIDNDEAAFLEFASQQQAEMDGRRFAVTAEVKEFRSEVAQLQAAMTSGSTNDLKDKKKNVTPQSNKKSQVELLAGVVRTKRKRSETEVAEQTKSEDKSAVSADGEVSPGNVKDEAIAKKQRPSQESLGDPQLPSTMESHLSEHSSTENSYSDTSAYKPVRIPSLGIYSDSSDSESSSSDSDILPTLFTLSSSSNSK